MLRLSLQTCALFVLFFFSLAPAHAQETRKPPQPIVVPSTPISGLPISLDHFTATPPSITLVPRGEGARNGRIWLRTSAAGLYIAGQVDGPAPDFPRSKNEILSKDHVEVWLAATPNLDLPAIGWGSQFGQETLPKGPESCGDKQNEDMPNNTGDEQKCREWAIAQTHYRPYFKRLFVRQWLLAPDLAAESYATPAFDEIMKRFSGLGDVLPDFMQPQGAPQLFLFPAQAGYGFEIFIPFEAFPPLSSLRPAELVLLVDVFNAAPAGKKMGAYSTSSDSRAYGKLETFNALRLDPPNFFRLTPCDMPLAGSDKAGEYHPAWFFPTRDASQTISDTFTIVNDPAGYRYEPAGLSPTVRRTHYFWKQAGEDEWVCGPHLTYRKGGQSESVSSAVSEDGFDTLRLPDGHLLAKTGPSVYYSEFGSGQCGACPRTDLFLFELGKDHKFYQVLKLGTVVGGPPGIASQDFTVSPDWSEITEYDQEGGDGETPGDWSATTWCRKPNPQPNAPSAHLYEKCGVKENVQPPDPPVLKELRGPE